MQLLHLKEYDQLAFQEGPEVEILLSRIRERRDFFQFGKMILFSFSQ